MNQTTVTVQLPEITREHDCGTVVYRRSTVGELTPEERKRCKRLTFGINGTMSQFVENEENLDPDRKLVLAICNDIIIGWAVDTHEDDYWQTYDIGTYVQTDFRRMGIGTVLAQLLKEHLNKGSLRCYIHNRLAKAFYRSLPTFTEDQLRGDGLI